MSMTRSVILFICCFFSFAHAAIWNDPHDESLSGGNVYYSSFSERPRTLDPARSYSSNEWLFIAQIYEPPLQYHYLLRPFTLEPLLATHMPDVKKTDEGVVYTIHIKPHIKFQPHPAFAKNNNGAYRYHQLSLTQVESYHELKDFKYTGSRELTAADFVYEIKRLADPKLASPIYGMMAKHIVGMKDFYKSLHVLEKKRGKKSFIDLRQHPMQGLKVIDRYTYQITLYKPYPQLRYWLAMPFFAAVPWEADLFYSQPGMEETNISFDWYPIGTGPYMLTINNPNRVMKLERNPNFHKELFPTTGEPIDQKSGVLKRAGQRLPFVDTAVYSLERESIPRWSKFLQGYYDLSGISSDSFDQAIVVAGNGDPSLTEEMRKKGIILKTSTGVSTFYIGFNMLDKIVGGYSEKQRKLRQAISIALDYEEFIAIFINGRGIPAQGPLPPGIFGYVGGKAGLNPIVYEWKHNHLVRKKIEVARQLMKAAGYENGINPRTGKPLVLNYDVPTSSAPDDKAKFAWFRKQFAKLGVELNIRGTQYNRFQEKMRKGHAQIFTWGWHADYPDPENFLFLLYGDNGKVKHGGENAANYNNPKYNKWFEQMRAMPNTPERMQIISKMINLVRRDSPWVWGFHPQNYMLAHQWMAPSKPNEIANNSLKYAKINVKGRLHLQEKWNKPIIWPIIILFLIIIGLIAPVVFQFWRKEYSTKC